jgi:hypothetical protein
MADGLPDDAIQALCEDRVGNLWIGTGSGGIVRYRNRPFEVYSTAEGLAHNHVRAILEDSSGTLWVGTYGGGVSLLRDGALTSLTRSDGLPSDFVVTLFEDSSGAVWVGTDGSGLARVAGDGIIAYGEDSGVGDALVRTFLEDSDGTLWIGTSGSGLFRFRDGRFTAYTVREGLWSNKIFEIFDPTGTDLWLTSNRGVFRVSKNSLEALDIGQIDAIPCEVFGREPGVGNLECNGGYKPAGWLGSDGRLWFGTVHGLAALDPTRVRLERVAPPVRIERLLVDRKSVPVESRVSLPPGVQSVSFRYVGLDFTSPRAVTYRYKLEGVESVWVEAGARREVNYTHLPPGNYRFLVKACNAQGQCTPVPARLSLSIAAPFWRTPWFMAGATLILGACVYSIGRWRQHLRYRRERERAELVRSLTVGMLHELRQPLQVIQSKLEVMQLKPDMLGALVEEILAQLAKLRAILAELDELQYKPELKTRSYARDDTMVDLSSTSGEAASAQPGQDGEEPGGVS